MALTTGNSPAGFNDVVAAWLGRPGARVVSVQPTEVDTGDTEHGFDARSAVRITWTEGINGPMHHDCVDEPDRLADLWRFVMGAWPEEG